MLQYNVEFFDRSLQHVYNCSIDGVPIEDDYISVKITRIDVPATFAIQTGHFIRIHSENVNFFGVVVDVSPGEYATKVTFKPFISVFDENFLFDTWTQGISSSRSHPTLEATLQKYITELYITAADQYQRLPISVSIDTAIAQTQNWTLHVTPMVEGSHYCIMNLYDVLIARALKEYGVVIDVVPDFKVRTIRLIITKRPTAFSIDANHNTVNVKTIKYNDRQNGINKLEVYNTEDFSQYVHFYVHSDRSWDAENVDRLLPVSRDVRGVAPNGAEGEDFLDAAIDIGYSVLSGLSWDNLIELDVYYTDPNVKPLSLGIGQLVTVWYKGASYTSILTGRILSDETMTLLFGSERIEFTKRRKLNGGN